MADLKFIEEGESTSFADFSSLGWIPHSNEEIDLDGVLYKVESVKYVIVQSGAVPLLSNPSYVSKNYVEVTVSIVP